MSVSLRISRIEPGHHRLTMQGELRTTEARSCAFLWRRINFLRLSHPHRLLLPPPLTACWARPGRVVLILYDCEFDPERNGLFLGRDRENLQVCSSVVGWEVELGPFPFPPPRTLLSAQGNEHEPLRGGGCPPPHPTPTLDLIVESSGCSPYFFLLIFN